ncbi:MAG: YncE family protein [Acidobacteriota bacterium]
MHRSNHFGLGRTSIWKRTWLAIALAFLALATSASEPDAQGIAPPFGFVANAADDTLRVIALSTGAAFGAPVDLLPEGALPTDVTLHPNRDEVWICGALGNGVVIVDAVSHTILDHIDLTGTAAYPVDIVFDADGSTAYVAGRDAGALAVIDVASRQVIDTIVIPLSSPGPGKMTYSAARDRLYVVEYLSDALYIVDPDTEIVTEISVGNQLWDLVLDPTEGTLYLTDRGDDTVKIFSLNTLTVIATLDVGDDPWGIDLTPDGTQLAVASEDSAEVAVIDTATNIVTIVMLPDADADARDVDVRADGTRAYVPSGNIAGDDAVYVIDLSALSVDRIDLDDVEPTALAVAPENIGPAIFADDFESGNVSAW